MTIVDGENKRNHPWGGGVTELSRWMSSQKPALDMRAQLTLEVIADDLRATMLRLDAWAIARGSLLGAPVLPDGSGVVGIVDDLLTSGTGDEQIRRVNDVLQTLSPHVKSVGAKRHPASGGKELQFVLRSGSVIPASQMSDGIVLAAALVLISLCSANRRALIEEPENGLHPRQLKVVADTIRSIAETQGIQRMSEVRGLDDLASEMALGELWYNVGDSNLARPA